MGLRPKTDILGLWSSILCVSMGCKARASTKAMQVTRWLLRDSKTLRVVIQVCSCSLDDQPQVNVKHRARAHA